MNTNFQTYRLNKKANDYFEERFKEGLTLSNYLKKTINLAEGQVSTFAPSNLSEDHLLTLNGCILGEPIPKNGIQEIDNKLTSKWLVKQIKSYLSESKNNYCILEDAEEYPAKGIITRFSFRNVLFKNNELYYILGHKDSEKSIEDGVRENSCFYIQGMGIFTTIENISSYFSDKDHIKNDKFFAVAAKNTQKIYIQAYDHEGYVLWEKN